MPVLGRMWIKDDLIINPLQVTFTDTHRYTDNTSQEPCRGQSGSCWLPEGKTRWDTQGAAGAGFKR